MDGPGRRSNRRTIDETRDGWALDPEVNVTVDGHTGTPSDVGGLTSDMDVGTHRTPGDGRRDRPLTTCRTDGPPPLPYRRGSTDRMDEG